jgi:hypothetical protein
MVFYWTRLRSKIVPPRFHAQSLITWSVCWVNIFECTDLQSYWHLCIFNTIRAFSVQYGHIHYHLCIFSTIWASSVPSGNFSTIWAFSVAPWHLRCHMAIFITIWTFSVPSGLLPRHTEEYQKYLQSANQNLKRAAPKRNRNAAPLDQWCGLYVCTLDKVDWVDLKASVYIKLCTRSEVKAIARRLH